MPPKDSTKDGSMKQKTLHGFFQKSQANASKAAPEKAAGQPSSLKSSASSSATLVETRPKVDKKDTQEAEKTKIREPVKTAPSSSSPASYKSSKSDAIDVDEDSGEESDVVGKKKKTLKRKVVANEDSEDVDIEKFSLSLSQFKKPVIMKKSSFTGSDASSGSNAGRVIKRRRTSAAASEDEDFIVGSDEDEDDAPSASHSRRSSMSKMDVDDSDEDAPPKAQATKPKAKASRPPAKPAGASSSGAGANLFITDAEKRTMNNKVEKKSNEDCFSFLKDMKDADGIKENEPGYNPRTLRIPPSAWKTFTPFERQFWEIKQNYFDTVLFFQKGKFYELYESDAQLGHQLFDLKLTDRVKMKMVGVPDYTFDLWASKFLAKGYKVGRVDQAETQIGAEMRKANEKGKAKAYDDKIVKRELTKVLTSGTIVDGNMLHDDQAGHCVTIREFVDEDAFGVCSLDAATGEFNLCAFVDDVCRTKLETMMRQLRPKEFVHTKGNLSVATTRLLKNILPASCIWTVLREVEGYSYEDTIKELHKMFPGKDADDDETMDDVSGIDASAGIPEGIRNLLDSQPAVEAIGQMIWYLRQLNIDKELLGMKNFNIYDPMKQGQGLTLDGQTLSHIEVLQNNEGTDEGSLLRLLSRCSTPFGKRLFRIWLCMPLRNVAAINDRLDAVDDLMNNPSLEGEFQELAKGLPDLERIVSRIHAGRCKILDFLKVLRAFEKMSKGLKKLEDKSQEFESKTLSQLLRGAPDLKQHIDNLRQKFAEPPKDSKEKDDLLLPQEGNDEAYDEVEAEIDALKDKLDAALKKLASKTGAKLEYWSSSQGNKDIYQVQTSTSFKGKLPSDWVKSGGTKAVNRWDVPELRVTIRSFKEAQETRNQAMRAFKLKLFQDFDTDRDLWLRAVRVMAELDCLFSLAKSSVALGEPHCRPELAESDEAYVDFVELRHPALCLKNDFIPNNVRMGGGQPGMMLLTGANMAGKSTVMRMTAAGVIMAQLGMHVPAKSARLSPIDKILTRMGAYDNMFSNASTFRVEMDEACKILNEATPRSLVILDELGRGTSTFDGMAIAGAVLHQLATHTQGLALFATHYSSLTQDFAYHPNIRNMFMSTALDDEKRELIFLYNLTEGIASSSFGTHVASLAGVPPAVVSRAEVISIDFAAKFQKKLDGKQISALPLTAQADFAYLWRLATGKPGLDTDPVRLSRALQLIGRASKDVYTKA